MIIECLIDKKITPDIPQLDIITAEITTKQYEVLMACLKDETMTLAINKIFVSYHTENQMVYIQYSTIDKRTIFTWIDRFANDYTEETYQSPICYDINIRRQSY